MTRFTPRRTLRAARPRNSRRALTLGMVLAILAVIALLATTLISASVAHRILADRNNNTKAALNLARSAVSRAITQLQQNRSFGTGRRPQDEVVVTLEGLPPGARGRVTFAQEPGQPWSTNALEQPDSVTGFNTTAVPGHSAHIWGVGECGGVTRRVEAILTVPAFPYALAANGRIESRGGLRVAGLESLPARGTSLDEKKLTSASLLSNAGGAEAVKLSAQSDIRGDVRAVGGVELEPGARVEGQVLQVEPGPLASPRLSDYDPRAAGLDFTSIEGEEGQAQPARFIQDAALRREGSLTLEGLTLENGLLFVNGNLKVRGGIQGQGLVICTGNVTVEGRNELQAGEGVALLAGGDVKLAGSGPEGSFFQGLVCGQSLEADSITLVGALMATGNQSAVLLEDSRVVMPQPLREGGEWSYGGSGKPYTDDTKYAIYNVGGTWKREADLQPGDSWTTARVFEKRPDGQYTRWTFASSGGPPGELVMSAGDVRYELGFMLIGQGQAVVDQAVTAVNNLHEQASPDPPDPPTRNPATGPARLSVKPSQFLRLEERMRVALWLES